MKLNDHIIWRLAQDVRQICEPLFSKLGITYMDYARFYRKDHSVLIICSDPAYVDFFLNHKIYKGGPVGKINEGFHLWNEYIDKNFLGVVKNTFQHSHGLTVLKSFKDYDEIVNFAALGYNERIYDFYLNHQEMINKFIRYFQEQATDIIELSKKHRFDFSNQVRESNISGESDYKELEKQLFTKYNYVYLSDDNFIKLSKREAECLIYLKQGFRSKEIAKILEISYRTVEAYCDTLRQKMNCKSRLELVGKISNQLVDIDK